MNDFFIIGIFLLGVGIGGAIERKLHERYGGCKQ